MKIICFVLLLAFMPGAYSQKLSDDLKLQPDGVSIYYFDYTGDPKIRSAVFLGEESEFRYFEDDNYKRVAISGKETEIKTIRTYLTFGLIDKLNACCRRRNCPDTIKGYLLNVKKGDKVGYIFLDEDFTTAKTCGREALDEVIGAFKKL